MAWTTTKSRSGKLSASYLVSATGGLNETVTLGPTDLVKAGMRGAILSQFLDKVFPTAAAVVEAFAALGGEVIAAGENSSSSPKLGCDTLTGKPQVIFVSSTSGKYAVRIRLAHSITE